MLGKSFWPTSLIFWYIAIHLHSQWNLRNHLLIHELYSFCVKRAINSNTKCLTIYWKLLSIGSTLNLRSKSKMATLKHMQHIFTIFFMYNAWIKRNKKTKTTLFTVLAYLQHINKSLFQFVKHPLSEMYSRLCPVKSSLHFYYIYSIRIWNENTLAVYTEKLKLETYCTVQWFFKPWEMRHLKNVCKKKKERKMQNSIMSVC